MKQIAAEKPFWAVIENKGIFFAVTTGDTASDALDMFLGDTPRTGRVAICEEGCAGRLRFDEGAGRVSVRASRIGAGCLSACGRIFHVEPLTVAHLADTTSLGYDRVSCELDEHLIAPNAEHVFQPAMSEEEYNVLVAQEKLYEAQRVAEGVPVG